MLNKVFIGAVFVFSASLAFAKPPEINVVINESMDVADFISKAYTPTFDCPTAKLNKDIDKVLALDFLTPQQTLQLTSMKTHGLICSGKMTQAEEILQRLLANDEADRNTQYYLSAIFQYGFIYDVKENPERCDYFMLARDSAKNKFVDVYLSASLGFITECIDSDINKQLFGISELLEITARMNDPAALAHAYNRVGIFYTGRNQNRLAASQYLKAYEIVKDVYTKENSLTILGNAMSALTASGDLPAVKDVLDKYVAINATLGSQKVTFHQFYYQARYYNRVGDYENLATTLEAWDHIVGIDNNPIHIGLYHFYRAVLCYQNNDIECLNKFLENEVNAPINYLNYVKRSDFYRPFLIKANMLLGNKAASQRIFDDYVTKVQSRQKLLQDNIDTFDVITLHNKILNLEKSLKEEEKTRSKLTWLFVSIIVAVSLFIVWCLRRKYLDAKSHDSLTGFLNKTAIIKKLTNLSKPNPECTNALAIFDIDNFVEMNSTLGLTTNDFVLQQIAKTLKKITRSSDLLGRLGPQQFVICLVNIEEDAAQDFFERVKIALANTFSNDSRQHPIGVDSSMSIFYSSETFRDIDEILKNMLLSLSMKNEQV